MRHTLHHLPCVFVPINTPFFLVSLPDMEVHDTVAELMIAVRALHKRYCCRA